MSVNLVSSVVVRHSRQAESPFSIPRTKELYPKRIPKVRRLDNGLRVIVEEMPGRNLASLRIVVGAGSVDETTDGAAHLTEHMVFNGTRNRSGKQIRKESEIAGTRINAHTKPLTTGFESDTLAENILVPLELVIDMIFNHTLERFGHEKDIVVNELRRSKNGHEEGCPHCHLRKFSESLWNSHPIFKDPIGTDESISSIRRDEIESFLERLYTPDNVVISVAGKCKEREILKKVQGLTKGVKGEMKKLPLPPFLYTRDVHAGKSKRATITTLNIACDAPSEEDKAAMCKTCIVVNAIGPRLWQKLRGAKGIAAYDAGASYYPNPLGGQIFLATGVDDEKSISAAEIILKEVENVKSRGISPLEFLCLSQDLRTHTLGNFDFCTFRAEMNAEEVLDHGEFIPLSEMWSSVSEVDNKRIMEHANELFAKEGLSLIAVGGKKLPNESEFGKLIDTNARF